MLNKKTIIIPVLFILNLWAYYYLTEYVGINSTFEEMASILVISLIFLPIGILLPSTFIYALKSINKELYVPFKKVYFNFYFYTGIGFYAVMLLIAGLTYVKVTM